MGTKTDYYDLLVEKGELDMQINAARKELHKDYMKRRRKQVIAIDVLVILTVLFNFGALAATNIMVEKKAAEQGKVIQYAEVNPITAEVLNLEEHPESRNYFNPMKFLHFYVWAILLFLYLYPRSRLIDDRQLVWVVFVVLWYFILLGNDFFNDVGFIIGRWFF